MYVKPNIIVVLADDMGYGDMSCAGATKVQTPNFDRVAAEGMRFTDMHSTSAVCTPSRYSLLTGRYCWRTWLDKFVLGGFGSPLIEHERLTMASMLKKSGYHTAAIGKWHLGLHWFTRDGRPLSESDRDGWNTDGFDVDYSRGVKGGPTELGFDYWFGIAGSLDMPPYCFLEGEHTVGQPRVEKEPYSPQQRRGLMVENWQDDMVDVQFAEQAVKFIDSHIRQHPEEPFFLYLAPSAPHRPCVPPDFMRGKSKGGLREDMVQLVDWVVGRVLDGLERNRILENTLLVLTSDNGARLTNYDGKDYRHKPNGDLRGGKGDIYDGGHREPFVAMWPEVIPAETTSKELLGLSDLFATCAEIVEEELPHDAAEDSRSFFPILRGERPDAPIHDALVHHALDGMFAVRRGPWKLVMGLGSGGFSEPQRYDRQPNGPVGQLYNILDDSRENMNLWNARPDIAGELSKILQRYQESGRSR